MGIGIFSIIMYALFIAWALLTAPSGEKEVPAMGSPYLMISTLLMAYSIHDIISQNILKHQDKSNYGTIILATFIIGTIIYTFVGFGSFCKIHLTQPLLIVLHTRKLRKQLRTISNKAVLQLLSLNCFMPST